MIDLQAPDFIRIASIQISCVESNEEENSHLILYQYSMNSRSIVLCWLLRPRQNLHIVSSSIDFYPGKVAGKKKICMVFGVLFAVSLVLWCMDQQVMSKHDCWMSIYSEWSLTSWFHLVISNLKSPRLNKGTTLNLNLMAD